LDQEKKLNQSLDNKRQEYLKEMNSIIDSKIAAVHKLDTSSIEYQTVVSN
jgi:NAD+--asparagine ADP-ribosyltransferase